MRETKMKVRENLLLIDLEVLYLQLSFKIIFLPSKEHKSEETKQTLAPVLMNKEQPRDQFPIAFQRFWPFDSLLLKLSCD